MPMISKEPEEKRKLEPTHFTKKKKKRQFWSMVVYSINPELRKQIIMSAVKLHSFACGCKLQATAFDEKIFNLSESERVSLQIVQSTWNARCGR